MNFMAVRGSTTNIITSGHIDKFETALAIDEGSVNAEFVAPGALIPQGYRKVKYFKYDLLTTQDILQHDPHHVDREIREELMAARVTALPQWIVVQYLHGFVDYCWRAFTVDSLFESPKETNVKLIFTMPSCWSPQTREAFKDAAGQAARGRESIIAVDFEFEGMAALRSVCYHLFNELEPYRTAQDAFFVIDSGALTVDMTLYRFRPEDETAQGLLAPEKKFLQRSRLCGGWLMDRQFKTWLEEQISSLFSDEEKETLSNEIEEARERVMAQ
ncbi:hypothetical protein B0I35DRAFT_279896 [Stachybotrys elegans]|uniref:Uncharacterized protein n=1 Tax=Stachybotrys elegans TaxID=80388 RepID=A0A8K0WQN0_9HYPO|nr:hypothetical protein B0I35DRAFT_279896 [Stachybotrys elegans]